MIAKGLTCLMLLISFACRPDQDPTRPQPLQETTLRDSTKKTDAKEFTNTQEKWDLNYILYADQRHLASINSILMHEGQQINHWTLVHIEPDSVDLVQGSKRKHLRLFGSSASATVKETQP